jgi:hypothetical protein
LGESLSPEYRYGLGLILRRGLWGWAQGMAKTSFKPYQPARSIESTPQQQKIIVRIFAAMVLGMQH